MSSYRGVQHAFKSRMLWLKSVFKTQNSFQNTKSVFKTQISFQNTNPVLKTQITAQILKISFQIVATFNYKSIKLRSLYRL